MRGDTIHHRRVGTAKAERKDLDAALLDLLRRGDGRLVAAILRALRAISEQEQNLQRTSGPSRGAAQLLKPSAKTIGDVGVPKDALLPAALEGAQHLGAIGCERTVRLRVIVEGDERDPSERLAGHKVEHQLPKHIERMLMELEHAIAAIDDDGEVERHAARRRERRRRRRRRRTITAPTRLWANDTDVTAMLWVRAKGSQHRACCWLTVEFVACVNRIAILLRGARTASLRTPTCDDAPIFGTHTEGLELGARRGDTIDGQTSLYAVDASGGLWHRQRGPAPA